MTSDAWTLNDVDVDGETTPATNTNDVRFSFQPVRRRFSHVETLSFVIFVQIVQWSNPSLRFVSVQHARKRREEKGKHRVIGRKFSLDACRHSSTDRREWKDFFSLSLSFPEKKRRESDGKASVPASFCFSFVIATWTLSSTHTKKANGGGGNGDSISLNRPLHFRESSLVSFSFPVRSLGRRHDFKEVRDLKASSLLVRPTTTYIQTHNNIDTSCLLVSDSLCVRKPRFPSAFNSVHALMCTNRNRSFSVLKKRRRGGGEREREREGNDNDGIATSTDALRFS